MEPELLEQAVEEMELLDAAGAVLMHSTQETLEPPLRALKSAGLLPAGDETLEKPQGVSVRL